MATTTLSRPAASIVPGNGRTTAAVGRARRNPLHIVAGAFLVVVLSLAFMWMQLRTETSMSVLVVARPVAAGQTITSGDLRAASMVPDASVAVVPESQAATVVGRTAAVPLVAGALLSPDQIGPAAWPAAGQAVVAVPVKPGRVPTGVSPGARVLVLTVATDPTAAGTGQSAGVVGTVVDIASNADASGTVVVSLLLRSSDAGIAAAGGEATLVLLGPAG
jgi:hypothetical protein